MKQIKPPSAALIKACRENGKKGGRKPLSAEDKLARSIFKGAGGAVSSERAYELAREVMSEGKAK